MLVAASNGSFSAYSSVGGQSLSIGKPHAYARSPPVGNVFTRLGLIPNAPSAVELVAALNRTFREEDFAIGADAMALAGVPVNGSANTEARLRALLRRYI